MPLYCSHPVPHLDLLPACLPSSTTVCYPNSTNYGLNKGIREETRGHQGRKERDEGV